MVCRWTACSLFEGRASGSPTMDLFITLLSLGRAGYRKLFADRKEMYQYLHHHLSLCAERHGQRLLRTKNNTVSVGKLHKMTLLHFPNKNLVSAVITFVCSVMAAV